MILSVKFHWYVPDLPNLGDSPQQIPQLSPRYWRWSAGFAQGGRQDRAGWPLGFRGSHRTAAPRETGEISGQWVDTMSTLIHN